jgi:adenylate cyclase
MNDSAVERRLTTVLAADVAGYTRLMSIDEAGTMAALRALRTELLEPRLAAHRGRVVKLMGDGTLIEFPSVVDAVACAVGIRQALRARAEAAAPDSRLPVRIGINLGDVLVEAGDLYGDGVNVAFRLQGLAEPGEIVVSRAVRDEARDRLPFGFAPMGEVTVKNHPRPLTPCRLLEDRPSASPAPPSAAAASLSAPPAIAVPPFLDMSGSASPGRRTRSRSTSTTTTCGARRCSRRAAGTTPSGRAPSGARGSRSIPVRPCSSRSWASSTSDD